MKFTYNLTAALKVSDFTKFGWFNASDLGCINVINDLFYFKIFKKGINLLPNSLWSVCSLSTLLKMYNSMMMMLWQTDDFVMAKF